MRQSDLIRFVRRDWDAVAAAKEQHWLRRKRSLSPADLLALSEDLRRHARRLHPEGASEADRRTDLETHSRVGRALRVVALVSR